MKQITIKNSKNYKLKELSKILYYMKDIIRIINDTEINDGYECSLAIKNKININSILRYNEIDCMLVEDLCKFINNIAYRNDVLFLD